MREVDGAHVHGLGDGFVNHVDHELPPGTDVLRRVLANRRARVGLLAGTVRHAEDDQHGVNAHVVVRAEGGGVDPTGGVHARHEGDGTWIDQADDEIVAFVRRDRREIKFEHVTRF